jgi:anti-sigma regulatory factor (Ser/Thr protein kinase)
MNQLQKSFTYHHESGELAFLIRTSVAYVEEQLTLLVLSTEILPKIQWVITELLMNGAKHSGVGESTLLIEFKETGVAISREDSGPPLRLWVDEKRLELTWPLGDYMLDQQFEVYLNGMDSLQIYTESNEKVIFQVIELDDIEMPLLLNSTSEHFGLLIIAKAADRFNYTWENDKNIFKTTFNY